MNTNIKTLNYFLILIQIILKKLKEISIKNLYSAVKVMKKQLKKNFIYVCGNGGSAAIANHYVCDFFKQL